VLRTTQHQNDAATSDNSKINYYNTTKCGVDVLDKISPYVFLKTSHSQMDSVVLFQLARHRGIQCTGALDYGESRLAVRQVQLVSISLLLLPEKLCCRSSFAFSSTTQLKSIMCACKLENWAKRLAHCVQIYGRSPMWMIMFCKLDNLLNFLWQTLQLKGCSSTNVHVLL